jgi:Ca2+-binding RTX toxin-like protein
MIRENYIDFIDRADATAGTNAAIKIVSHFGAIDRVTVDSNVLLGGGYTVYTGADGNPVSNVTFTNNDIGLARYGDLMAGDHGANFVWQNNHSFSSGALAAWGSSSPVKPVAPAPSSGAAAGSGSSSSSPSPSPVKLVPPAQPAETPAVTTKAHYIPGSELQDVIFGTAGKDAIALKGGFDICLAGAGDDAIYGGLGQDWIAGQAGKDRYVYKSVLDSLPSAMQRDVIVDWRPGHDRIDLRTIDANTKQGGNQEFSWIGTKAFSGTAGELRSYFNGRSTIVEADVNGDKHADMQIELFGKHLMKISDFLL